MATVANGCKTLIIFDFDETVIDGTTIYSIRDLHPPPYPPAIHRIGMDHGWNEKNTALFASLHDNGIGVSEIRNKILAIPLVTGMIELFHYLRHDKSYEVIILSGAVDLFIEWYLQDRELDNVVTSVYANYVNIKDDKLVCRCYHHQDSCSLCVRSLCKGQVLEELVKEKMATGTNYSRVCYVGDGDNDFCPSLRLSAKDYVFPRADYALDYRIKSTRRNVAANVVPWDSGHTIMEALKTCQDEQHV